MFYRLTNMEASSAAPKDLPAERGGGNVPQRPSPSAAPKDLPAERGGGNVPQRPSPSAAPKDLPVERGGGNVPQRPFPSAAPKDLPAERGGGNVPRPHVSGSRGLDSLRRLAPVRRLTELRPQRVGYFAGLRKAPGLRPVVDRLAVQLDPEHAVRPAPQLSGLEERRPEAEHLVHQAHGLVQIVSRDAVLDG